MNWDNIQQLIRIVAQVGAGALVSKGVITEDIASQLIGGVMSLAMVGWWIFWNKDRATTTTPSA